MCTSSPSRSSSTEIWNRRAYFMTVRFINATRGAGIVWRSPSRVMLPRRNASRGTRIRDASFQPFHSHSFALSVMG